MMEDTQGADEMVPGSFSKYMKMGENSGAVGASAGVGRYLVTEKVHGANFCLIATFVEGGMAVDVSFAKRTAIIGRADDAEDFYNCRSAGLLRELAPLAESVLRRVAAEASPFAEVVAVHIFGELFGGRYPHPDVEPAQGLEPVQIGIWYAPTLRFMAFDVAMDVPGCPRTYLDFPLARETCEACGLFFGTPLFEGTLAECVDFPIEFESTIPARLGLPRLLDGDSSATRNLAEGVVVRPLSEPRTRLSGSGRKESGRGLFKQKIAAFSEKRYQNDNWKKGRAGGDGVALVVTDLEEASYEIMASVNEQRLAAVMSKIGRVDPRDKSACRQLLEDFKQDARESLEAREAAALQGSSELQEELDEICRAVIKQVLLGPGRRPCNSTSPELEGPATIWQNGTDK